MSIIEEENETTKMRCALSSIAKEVQQFHKVTQNSGDAPNSQEMFDILYKYKTKLKLKKEQIARLHNNLRTACTIAKTLTTAKSNEAALLQGQLNDTRNHVCALEEQQKQNTITIATLKAENETLRNKLQSFINFIEFGYKELQNISNKPLQDVSLLKRLQKIIHCCCEYCADNINHSKKCSILENKNKFMSSKITILEKQLEIISNELQNIRTFNRSQKQKEVIDIVQFKGQVNSLNGSEMKLSDQTRSNKKYLDLTCHLSSVRKLLHDQETLINDLSCLSRELSLTSTAE